ncbi:MAG: SPFH domain-containing protein, partial [Poseidonia sp.]
MDASAVPQTRFKDAPLSSINGFVGLGMHAALSIVLLLGQVLWAFAWPVAILLNVGGGLLWFLLWNSYVIVNPNEAVVAQFFGKYVGTLKEEGFRFFINPLYGKSRISLRINNFESSKLKVNDVNANPINIAAVVVWRVYDAAEAIFEVEKYQHYVQIQSEAALREMATKYPYDAIEEKDIGGITLSGHQDV